MLSVVWLLVMSKQLKSFHYKDVSTWKESLSGPRAPVVPLLSPEHPKHSSESVSQHKPIQGLDVMNMKY